MQFIAAGQEYGSRGLLILVSEVRSLHGPRENPQVRSLLCSPSRDLLHDRAGFGTHPGRMRREERFPEPLR